MTYTRANRILDDRRFGAEIPEQLITRALQLTGDVECPYDISEELSAMEKTNLEVDLT